MTDYYLVIPISYLNDKNIEEKKLDIFKYIERYQLISWAFSSEDVKNATIKREFEVIGD